MQNLRLCERPKLAPNKFVNFPISQGKTTPDKACHSVTFDSGNYVNQYGHSRYLYQLWVVNYVCFSKSCYNKCNQKRHVIETHAFKSQARSGVDDIV